MFTSKASARSLQLDPSPVLCEPTETPPSTALDALFLQPRCAANRDDGSDHSSSSFLSESDDDSLPGRREESRLENQNDVVECHGRQWTPLDTVLIDPGASFQRQKTVFSWPTLLTFGDKSYAHYFYFMFQMHFVTTVLQHTNDKLSRQGFRTIQEGDLFRWLSIRRAMTIEPRRGDVTVYWERQAREGSIATSANYGERFGMGRHYFEHILHALSFADELRSPDPRKPIRSLIEAFNQQRQEVVSPGDILCVDECMSAWHGLEGRYYHDGLAHKTKIARKPDGKGAELKSIADATSGVLLGLELVEGTLQQSQKAYYAQYGEGTAVTLRLTEPFRGSGRTVEADSAFALVKTMTQLEVLHGLRFMGMVNTASREFLKKELLSWFASKPQHGSFKLFRSETAKWATQCSLCAGQIDALSRLYPTGA